MSIGVSLFLLAVGAVLTWGVHVTDTNGIDINTIGVILMAVGVIGFLMSMLFWGGLGHTAPYGRRRYVEDRDVVVDDDPALLPRGRRVVRRTVRDDVV